MNGTRFDLIAQRFAGRRESRRQAASPTADSPAHEKTMFLFVQSFESGSIAPKEGAEGTYTLTLQHGLGQTVYFSDRPKRIVGSAPTPHVLDSLGFGVENPPNAALVVGTDDGGTDIAVVELTNPTYDTSSSTATYDISVLENFASGADTGFQETTADLAAVASSFGTAHLFIDDCSDAQVYCRHWNADGYIVGDDPGLGLTGMCWDYLGLICRPCDATGLMNTCFTSFPEHCTKDNPCAPWP